MKLLIIGTDTNIFKNGSDVRKRSLEYANNYDKYTVIVASSREKKISEYGIGLKKAANFISIYSPSKVLLFLKAINKTYKLAKGYDVISSQDMWATGLLALIVSFAAGKKLHVQIHTIPRLNILTKFTLRNAHRIRVVSERIKRDIERFTQADIDVLPVYIDRIKYRDALPDSRLRSIVPSTNFLILVMSRLEKEKNVDCAIEIFNNLVKRYPNATLIIAGSGNQKEYLEKISKSPRIVFLPWTNFPESFYKAADIFLTLSRFEGYGMTIVESLISKTPVITTNVGIASEYIKNEYNSWIVASPNEASNVIERIMSNPEEYRIIKKNLAEMSFDQILDFTAYKKKLYESFYKTLE